MSKKVAVLITHGIGSQKDTFADDAMDEINERIEDKGKNPDEIAWKPVFWTDIIQPRQTEFMDNIILNQGNDIDFIKLRRFVVSALGDAAAYQNTRGKETSTYTFINQHIKVCLGDLYNSKMGGEPCPLIIMAHSLGSHIMSSYIWDIQKKPNQTLSEFENMRYLAGMFTFGSNIPLFTFAHTEVEPFDFPGDKLSAAEKSKAEWLNYYDPDDVLGYPLRQLSEQYKNLVKDHHINAGGLLTSWNPLSHNGYWTDNDVTKPAADMIARFM